MFFHKTTKNSTPDFSHNINRLKEAIHKADTILIGAGAGLSTAAGHIYSGERFYKNFADFHKKYNISDIYSGGFYPFETLEEFWAWWSRQIYINRYDRDKKAVYQNLLSLVKEKDYFVLTTNADHLFQDNGFDKQRLFYTQGDYGLWQCSRACHKQTYDNEESVRKMYAQQENMKIPTELIPYCPKCHAPMTMNLRKDGYFVQDKGWDNALKRYVDFLKKHQNKAILLIELGVGLNTPSIIKYPFWELTAENKKAVYAYINLENNNCPENIQERAICIEYDIAESLERLASLK